jgi:deoxyribodipyrimidine photo-lyase
MKYNSLLDSLNEIDPIAYGKSRNFVAGAVTRLSPFVSRGILETKTILENIVSRGFSFYQVEKFVQQLAWRDYFQRVWQTKGNAINSDLKNPQEAKWEKGLPEAISTSSTGIEVIDQSISTLHSTGYMHNHLRMYVAFLACNLAGFHWKDPARWMYYHLLDGDWGSNALSWQWVAGTFSNKKYIANQENINHYTNSHQKGTYLDCRYEELALLQPPSHLQNPDLSPLVTNLPGPAPIVIDELLPTFIYNYYNLSPTWRAEEKGNRILLLEPSLFETYPVAKHCIDFMMTQTSEIPELQVFVGEFSSLKNKTGRSPLYYREHPLNAHYIGNQDARSWLVDSNDPVQGSFFSFWKKYEKQIKKNYFS